MKCIKCGTEYESGVCPNCGTYNDPLNLKRRREKSNKNIVLIVAFSICVVIAAVAVLSGVLDLLNANGIDVQSAMNQDTSPLSESEIDNFYASPTEYKNRDIAIGGMVAFGTQYDGETPYIQIYEDPENYERMTLIAYDGKFGQFNSGDYVMVSGRVSDVVSGQNAFGVSVTLPCIIADSVQLSSYKDVVSPTLLGLGGYSKTPIIQNGYSVALDRVEFAENETRIYMIVQNQGIGNFNLETYSARIIQNGKQYESTINWLADYPKIQDNIAVGVTTDGVITFPAIEQDQFQLQIDGYSDNWNESFETFVFDVSVTVQ